MPFKLHERISDQHLVGETVRIGDDWAESIVRCKLENCHVIVACRAAAPEYTTASLRSAPSKPRSA